MCDAKLTLVNSSKSFFIAKEINENHKNKKIFCLDAWSDVSPSSLPYLKNITIYDKNNLNRKSAKSLRNQINFNNELFNPDEFSKYINKNSILVSTGELFIHEENNPLRSYDKNTDITTFKGNKNEIMFIPISYNQETKLKIYAIKINHL